MSRLVTLLIFLVLSVWFGLTVFQHPGFVFISYQPWMIQMPFWFAILALFVIFGFFYLSLNCVERLQFWWFRVKSWFQFRRVQKSYSKTQHGLALLIEARWAKAEKLLLAGANQSAEPLMNYLGAARAAQEQGMFDRRSTYLKKAYQIAPDAELAIGLTQAELEIEHGEFTKALGTLNHLKDISPKHPRVLKLLEKVYVHDHDWQNLLKLLPLLRKSGALLPEQEAKLEKNVYCEILRSSKHKNLEALHKLWHDVPRHIRKNPDVVYEYATQLLLFKDTKEAAELTQKILKSTWSAPLVKLYGMLPFEDMNKQLAIVGGWLQLYGPHPETYLTLGKLCARIKLWGKAKDYFEKCLADGPNPEASLAYARLLESLGKDQEAVEKYRDGLGALASV